MIEKKEINNNLAVRLKSFRDVLRISSSSLSEIINLSQSTLSRIENGYTNMLYENIEILSEAFGITILQFQDPKFPVPSRSVLIKNLRTYTKSNNRDVDIKKILEKPQTAYYVDKIINSGFMNEYRTVRDILGEIKTEFNKNLISAQISKLLIHRMNNGILIRRKVENNKRDYEYRSLDVIII